MSIDPHNGAIRAYYGGSDANGFDFAQAGLQTGSSFKVFALVAALEQGIGLGYQVDSSPLTVDGIKITNVDGESCGTCNIAEALKQSLNTSYYRLMLKLKGGPQAVADAAHQAGIATSFPGVAAHAVRGWQGRTTQQRSRAGPVPDPGDRHGLGVRHAGRVRHLSPAAFRAKGRQRGRPGAFRRQPARTTAGDQRIPKAVADNVTAAMEPIAGYSRGHNLAGGRASAAKTGTTQLGDTTSNKDAWMVGYTPSLSTAVWVGTVRGRHAAGNRLGRSRLRLGPAVGHLEGDDGRRSEGHLQRDLPQADRDRRLRGCAGRARPRRPAPPSETVIQPTIEVAPGITIPVGPPTTITTAPPPPEGPAAGRSPAATPGPTATATAAVTEPAQRHDLAGAAGRRSA